MGFDRFARTFSWNAFPRTGCWVRGRQWWDSTGSQEPFLEMPLIPRTGCWLKSEVLNFSSWTPFTYNLFWQTSHRPGTNFQYWETRLKSGSAKISFERECRYKDYTDGNCCQLFFLLFNTPVVLNLYKHAEPLRSFSSFCRTPFFPNIIPGVLGTMRYMN